MFTLLTIMLSALLLSCQDSHSLPIQSIRFESMTRGGFRQIMVSEDSLTIENGSQAKKYAIQSKEWQQVLASLENVPMDKISVMQAPSTKHQYDGAWASQVHIQLLSGDVVSSATFDNENAPSELKPLLKALIKLEKSYSK